MTKEKTFSTVEFPEALSGYVLEHTQYCGRHVTKRKKGNSTHHLAKVLSLYLLLKAESPGAGLIQNYTNQLPVLASKFNISKRSFFMYLKQLEAMKLITRENKNIRIAGWEQLSRVLEINTKKRTKIQFNYGRGQKIHWWFAALEIKSNQELQQDTVWKKSHKNSNIASLLRDALLKRGFDLTRENDPEYYCSQLLLLMIEDFRFGTEVHEILINIRSDVNRSCKKIADSWSMSEQLVCYWKKQMINQKIISQATVEIMSEWRSDRKECGKNKFCRVVWDDKEKQRVWRLCKQISVTMPVEMAGMVRKKYGGLALNFYLMQKI